MGANLREGHKTARDTERANYNRITVAVVEGITRSGPDFSPKKGLKRLDSTGLVENHPQNGE